VIGTQGDLELREKIKAVETSIQSLKQNIKSVIYVDERKLEYLLASKLAGGHVILADSHGVGKTSLARALAGSIQWDTGKTTEKGIEVEAFNRIQCTVDLLPQDIIGYTRLVGTDLSFNKGPIFSHFVLCDEINLLTPKTQGSFFQAMEEQNVSIEGRTYDLPDPFFIIATMNLKGSHLFPLPAPQLDRFMIQLSMGFPSLEDEAAIVRQHGREDGWKDFKPVVESHDLIQWQDLVDQVAIDDDVVHYIVSCVRKTRHHPEILMGASPRTGVKISRLIRALALVRGRHFVDIDLVKEIFVTAVAHRLTLQDPEQPASEVLDKILKQVPVEKSGRV
jgi:MoxR-like ATPase